jgi:molecular chaperone DnaK (HSP70)
MRLEVPGIPSLIHYADEQVLVGRQVRDRGQLEAPATFRWMKHFISNRLELPRQVNGRSISCFDAGAEFLTRVLDYAASTLGLGDEEVAFTVPVEAYEHYQDWLTRVCETASIRRYRLLDEASAAALGYGVNIQANDVYMVVDFGGGTLDVSIVRVEGEATSGKRCHVLGKGGAELGGTTIDQWLYQDVLTRAKKQPEDVRHVSSLLLLEVERAKEALTSADVAEVQVTDPRTGAVIGATYTRTRFDDLLEERGLFSTLQRTLDHALAAARERGYEREHIKAVLLVGGSSLIPCVRRAVRQLFGERVKYHRPLDAVALGGAAFVGGVDFYDHIQHDYALRYYNRDKGDFDYLIIVPAGTTYPTAEPVRQLTVKASHDQQEYLGLNIYEIGRAPQYHPGTGLDLVFDPSGAARFQPREDPEITSHVWVNEQCPTFIHAQPGARKGDPRFPVQFTIDGNKRLCITVRDNLTGKVLMRDHPLIKLT